jgi:hypothetical protein
MIIDLCLQLFPWADFRKTKGGIKLTVKLDHQGKTPFGNTDYIVSKDKLSRVAHGSISAIEED